MAGYIPTRLYRTTVPLPGHEDAVPASTLVYVGQRSEGARFVVRPRQNRNNRWYWQEPTWPLPEGGWMWTLRALPAEGFYTLPEAIEDDGGRWARHALVQLGYNGHGRGIVFLAEHPVGALENKLVFSDRGRLIEDALLERLVWSPVRVVEPPRAPPDEVN